MAHSKITLFGMYEYGDSSGEYELFSGLTLPDGIPSDITDALITNILIRGGEFEVLYANPSFMINAIGLWAYKWSSTFERWFNALSIEYNPLENYDRFEDWNDQSSGSESKTGTESRNRASQTKRNEMTSGNDNSSQITTGNVENTISGFDASTYQPDTNAATSGNAENSSIRLSATGAQSEDSGMEINDNKESHVDARFAGHTGRIHGNIGVTTSQQMLQAELDIARFNFIDEMTDVFLQELTIFTY